MGKAEKSKSRAEQEWRRVDQSKERKSRDEMNRAENRREEQSRAV